MKKFLVGLLSLIVMVLIISTSLFSITISAANLTQAEFESKLSSAKTKYPHGTKKYEWSINGTVVGWECHGYARWLSWYVWGVDFANGRGTGWKLHKSTSSTTYIDTLVPGDVIRYRSSTSNKYNHSIFITKISGNTVYFTDCNSDGANTIRWNQSISKSTLNTYLKNSLYGDEAATYGYIAHYQPSTIGTQNTLTIKYHANGGTIDSQITSWTYKVTESVGINMRSNAGTGYSVVTALPQNTTFTVKNGETKTANGYTWGKTTYGGKTGWVVISDFVTKTSTNRNTDFYLSSSMVYRSSNSSVVTEQKTYGEDMPTGLYNVTTFGMTREGYRFVGWCTKSDGSATIFDQNDNTIKPETIYPDLKNGSATITVYAIWECTHSYSNNCDFDCNVCGVKREVKHNFTDGKNCELCGCELRDLADLNVDGEINVLDIARLKMILAGEMKVYIVSPDLDGDGSVSANDLTILMEFILADF